MFKTPRFPKKSDWYSFLYFFPLFTIPESFCHISVNLSNALPTELLWLKSKKFYTESLRKLFENGISWREFCLRLSTKSETLRVTSIDLYPADFIAAC